MNSRKFSPLLSLIAFFLLFAAACSSGGNEQKKEPATVSTPVAEAEVPETGIGPVKTVDIGAEIDAALAEEGKAIFENKCNACHKFEERYVGPALAGLTERRNHVWIMNMIMNPEEMTKKDPIAKQLLADYMTQMVNQNVTEQDARALLEYFRSMDNKQ